MNSATSQGQSRAARVDRRTPDRRGAILLVLAATLAACSVRPPEPDADVIVVGAGIAGLAAALEANDHGARVILLDASSIGGGHAVKAGGFALVDTPLQQSKGYADSPDVAYRDLMAWGEDANADWVRRYVEASRPLVHDWLTGLGVTFAFILDTPEHSVPRFHFTRGAAVNAVVPMMREALGRPGVSLRYNTEVTSLLVENGTVTGARTRDTRTGAVATLRAASVVVATGGAQADLAQVRANWRRDIPPPDRLYVGAGQFALGAGLRLARDAGAALARLDHQVTFSTGLPSPRDPAGVRGLLSQNPAAIWVDATGRRFVSELAPTKVADAAVLRRKPATHWLVFDADGLKELRVRDALWLTPETLQREILDNPALVHRADTVAALAAASGLPQAALEDTVRRWNQAVARGEDAEFRRFDAAHPDKTARPLAKPPYYAMQLYPMTRKNMGGVVIDAEARALNGSGRPVPGLYAAGEVTGVAGINGSYGGEGTFLGPSVYIGRLAGLAAAIGAGRAPTGATLAAPASPARPAMPVPRRDEGVGAGIAAADAASLDALLATPRAGYWHFESVHGLVRERRMPCTTCHTTAWPPGPATTIDQRQAQLLACTRCH